MSHAWRLIGVLLLFGLAGCRAFSSTAPCLPPQHTNGSGGPIVAQAGCADTVFVGANP